jgi:hypothetical protein
MASNSPIPTVEQGFFLWARKNPRALSDAIVTLNKLCSLEVAFGGNRFPVKFAGENALIDLKQTVVSSISNLPAMAAYTVLANPTGALAVPVATSTPILTSVTFGASGGSITGTTGSVDIAAVGSGKKVTLTTGSGANAEIVTPQASLIVRNTSSSSIASVRMFNDQNSATRAFELGYTGSAYAGSPFNTGGITGESAYLMSSGAYPLQFGSNNTYRGCILSAGRWLIATTTDDGVTTFQISGTASVSTSVTVQKIIYTGNVIELFGSGSPEGVVTADISSVYHRTNGGAGTSIYVKESGTGNTGWTPVGSGGGSPGGSNTQLQYNNSSAFGGISGATSDGTNVTFGSANLRATFPRITTGILDSNGAELIRLTATASAANDITVTNASTGNGPTISASGDDTDVNLNFAPKGTGTIVFAQTASGGLVINQTSSNQPYILIQVSGANKALVGAENGAGNIITGSSNGDLALRGIAAGVSISGNNGASVGLRVDTSNNVTIPNGSIRTSAPSGGTAQAWKLGTVASVTPTSQNRTIEVEVNGTTYYLTAKTTND